MNYGISKKIQDVLKFRPGTGSDEDNEIFSWTTGWVKAFENSRAEDMLVFINNATRFTAAYYKAGKREIGKFERIAHVAVKQTLYHSYYNPLAVEKYLEMDPATTFSTNSSPVRRGWLSNAAMNLGVLVPQSVLRDKKNNVSSFSFSTEFNHMHSFKEPRGKKDTGNPTTPFNLMAEKIHDLTGIDPLVNRVFVFELTQDLHIYKTVRKVIVPSWMKFDDFHILIQFLNKWWNYHLYGFEFYGEASRFPEINLMPIKDDLTDQEDRRILTEGRTLDEFFPEYSEMTYKYDYGDGWEINVKLLEVLDDYRGRLPFLIEADGAAPPEDVGGIGGFIEFRNAFLNPSDPEHESVREWAESWKSELSYFEKIPQELYRFRQDYL